jgi:hypothetical protein
MQGTSEVESKESCIHPSVGETAGVGLFLRRFELLRQGQEREYKGDEKGYTDGYKEGHIKRDRLHGSHLRRIYTIGRNILALSYAKN